LFGKRSSFIVTCTGIGSNNNRTKITKIEFCKIGECSLGLVAPFS
jgi:hypothetical protein